MVNRHANNVDVNDDANQYPVDLSKSLPDLKVHRLNKYPNFRPLLDDLLLDDHRTIEEHRNANQAITRKNIYWKLIQTDRSNNDYEQTITPKRCSRSGVENSLIDK